MWIVKSKNSTGASSAAICDEIKRYIITGRNEVLAKVIFSVACVKNSVHGGGACSKFSGGCLLQIFRGGLPAPNFRGGCLLQIFGGCLLQIFGGGACSKFSGGCLLQIFGGGACSKFSGGCLLQIFGGGSNFRNTVNVRPVRILLECILVILII